MLAESIQMNDDNVTRFFVLTTEPPAKERSDRMLFTAKGKASDLPEFMKQIADNDISIVSIHDRPQKTTLGSYIYLIECSGSGYREFELLRDLTGTFELGYRGAFSTK